LPKVAETHSALAFFLGGSQRRQQQCSQDGDDGNYHQQLDKRKTSAMAQRFHWTCGNLLSNPQTDKLNPMDYFPAQG
jgi:hypothetical protein